MSMDKKNGRKLEEAAVAYTPSSTAQARQNIEHIAAGKFKQTCLALLDVVAREHKELIVTKHGKPIAKLVPIESDEDQEARILAALHGSVTFLVPEDELLKPVVDPDDWQVIREGRSYHD